MKRTICFLLIGIVFVAAAACGGGNQSVEYTLEMTEFAFAPDAIEASVGQEVTLKIVNHGALDHELMIGREVVDEDGQPNRYAHNLFEDQEPMVMSSGGHDDEHADDEHADDEHSDDGHGGDDHGFMISMPAGDAEKTTSVTFMVTEDMVGEWEIGCFLDGGSHYHQGMVGTLTVNP